MVRRVGLGMDAFRRFQGASVIAALLLGCILATSTVAASETLARRGILGVSTIDSKGGVSIAAVLPSLPGEAAGLRRDDLIGTVDGAVVANNADFLKKLRRNAGETVTLGITRAGSPLTVRVTMAEALKEHDPDVDTRYDALTIDNSLRRVLVSAPRGIRGKRPAVLLIGGIGCFSIDVASIPEDAYTRLAHDLSKRGFVTMRLEKSGVGDSQGPPCATVDFNTEAASYGVAFDALRRDRHVDPAHVYVVGHSIGTVIGPRLALQKPVAGLVVADGVARNWLEYELSNSRRQEELSGSDPAAVDKALSAKEDCMHRLLVEKETESKIERERPECADYNSYPAPAAYMQQLASLNMAQPWTNVAVPVFAIYGSADFVTDEADHRRIVDIVNQSRPGNARLVVIPGMDHHLTPAGSQRAAFDRFKQGGSAPYDVRFGAAIASWLCAREACLATAS